VDPQINKIIYLSGDVFSLFCLLVPLLPAGCFALMTSDVIAVLECLTHYRLFVMVYIMKEIPTQSPVSPSKSHPWNGH
jgi:hypothetical protein